MDSHGYPDDKELEAIETWEMDWTGEGFRPLMDYVKSLNWEAYGSWEQVGDMFRLATGGWSGNESIICALEKNFMFQAFCAEAWRKGGLYIFDVRKTDGNRQVRDPQTPVMMNSPIFLDIKEYI